MNEMYIPANKLGKIVGNMNKILDNVHVVHIETNAKTNEDLNNDDKNL